MTDEESARLILDWGPLTRDELRAMSEAQRRDYFETMAATLKRLGPEQFKAAREKMRPGALATDWSSV